jgi:hypothetical protein
MSTLEERININQARIKANIANKAARVKAEKRAAEEAAAAERRVRREAAMAAEEAAMMEEARRKAQSEKNAAAHRAKVEADAKAVENARANQSRRNKERAAENAAADAKSLEIAFANIKTREQLLKNAIEEAMAERSSTEAFNNHVTMEINRIITLNNDKIKNRLIRTKTVRGKVHWAITPGEYLDVIINILHVKSYLMESKKDRDDKDTAKYDRWFKTVTDAADKQIASLRLRHKLTQEDFDKQMTASITTLKGVQKQPLPFYYKIAKDKIIFTEDEYDKHIKFIERLTELSGKIDDSIQGGRRPSRRVSRRKHSKSRRSRA